MLMPGIFSRNLFDEVFDPQFHNYGYQNSGLMKTDVRETDTGYELSIDLPGVKKEDLRAELKDGYLTVSATVNQNYDDTNSNGKYIRRERFSGSFQRSFYVGEDVREEDIRAKFEDGTLMLAIPKREKIPQVEQRRFIEIQG